MHAFPPLKQHGGASIRAEQHNPAMSSSSQHLLDPLLLLLLPLLVVSCTLLHAPYTCSAQSATNDTLTAGQALAIGDKLVSKDGNFALGFFQPAAATISIVGRSGSASASASASDNNNTTTSSGWYLGIWFNKIPVFTTVWVANRDDPILAATEATKLKISASDGNLVIVGDRNESVIWSTGISTVNGSSSNGTTLVLENSGNLALTSSSFVDRVLLWQSFDHPTDVFLPGMKFSRNKITGTDTPAISRKSLIDPGLGSYSIELDATGIVLKSRRDPSVTYWTYPSGPVALILKMILQRSNATKGLLSLMYVSNDQEEYYMYTSPNKSLSSTTPTFVSLDISGLLMLNIWSPQEQTWKNYTQPADVCTPFATCGSFTICNGNEHPACSCMKSFSIRSPRDWEVDDRTGGCIRGTPLHCNIGSDGRNTTTDVFHAISRVMLPYNLQSIDVVTNQSRCQEACLSSCSCTAYAYNNNKCSVWNGELRGVNGNDGIDNTSENVLYLRLAAQDLPSPKGSTRKPTTTIRVVTATGIIGFGLLMLMMFLLIWRREKLNRCCGSSSYKNQGNGGVIAFRYSDLVHATKNFSDKLGAGGFGSVFKGVLSSSNDSSAATYVAVKRLDGARQGEKQFRAEVSSIGLIQHINLVKLIGFCCEGDYRLLVYEHMINGSLEGHLFKSNGVVLSWNVRYEIALGVARGLSYLHQSCHECIIHCDIKPENVLLNASFAPKVADFGMAAFVGRDFSRVLTTFRGTAGYLAPEWLSGVAITPKIDVYGFGMVLLEIISGRRNRSPDMQVSNSYDIEFFPVTAISKLQGGDVQSLVDSELHGDFNLEQVERVCKVACWCIQDNEVDRPTMVEVVRLLEGLQEVNMPPMPRLLAAMIEQYDATSM